MPTLSSRETLIMTGNHRRVKALTHMSAGVRMLSRGLVIGLPLFGGEAPGGGEFLNRDAPMDAILLRRIIARRAVVGTAVVPDHDVADPPLVPVLPLRLHHVGFKFVDQVIAFGSFRALDREDLAGIEIQRLPVGFAVSANDRMDRRRTGAIFT